ncbi:MAG: hypothetical protein WCA27_03505 [Candidatus Sulfotelmatobacter sp.]
MAMKVRMLLSSVVLLTTMWLVACGHYKCGATFGNSTCTASSGGISQTGGGTGGTGTPTAFAFSGVSGAAGISGFTFSAAAANIYPTLNYTVATAPTGGGGELIVAQGKYLYGAFYGTGLFSQIYGWSIDSTGNLTPISGSPFTLPGWTGAILGSMASNPAGTMLFRTDPGAFLGESTVYAMQIGAGGILTQVAGSPFSIPFAPGGMTTDGQGKYLYVLALATTESPVEIGAYNIGISGALTAVVGSPFVYPMAEVVGDASGQYLIGTTSGTNGADAHLYVFDIQQTGSNAGAISPVVGSPFTTLYSPYNIAVQPNSGGVLLYSFSLLTNGTFNPIEGYQLNTSTGALTPVPGSPFLSFLGSEGEFDQSGNYLFVTNETTLTAYRVSSAGLLTGDGSIVEGFGPIAITDVP